MRTSGIFLTAYGGITPLDRKVLYTYLSIVFSMGCIRPTCCQEKQPHTIKFPPPCFTSFSVNLVWSIFAFDRRTYTPLFRGYSCFTVQLRKPLKEYKSPQIFTARTRSCGVPRNYVWIILRHLKMLLGLCGTYNFL